MFLQERGWAENLESRKQASFKASEIAFQKALYQLGTEGWEIVSDPALDFETVDFDEFNKTENKSFLFNRKDNKAVYFKRIKP